MHLDKLLKERLKNIDEKSLITLYYELLSSGYSVSEVLNSVYSIQRKSQRGNIDLGAYPRLTSDRAPTDIAAEVASANRAQADALHFLNLSASHRAGVSRTEKPQAAGNAPSHGREADYRELLRDNLFGPGSDIHGSAGTLTSTNREVLLRPSDVEQIRPLSLRAPRGGSRLGRSTYRLPLLRLLVFPLCTAPAISNRRPLPRNQVSPAKLKLLQLCARWAVARKQSRERRTRRSRSCTPTLRVRSNHRDPPSWIRQRSAQCTKPSGKVSLPLIRPGSKPTSKTRKRAGWMQIGLRPMRRWYPSQQCSRKLLKA